MGQRCGSILIELTFDQSRLRGSGTAPGLSTFELQDVRLSDLGRLTFKAYARGGLDFYFDGLLVDGQLRGTLTGGMGIPLLQWAAFDRTPVTFVRQCESC